MESNNNGRNNNVFNNRGGVVPDTNKIRYSISTGQVSSYLNKKLQSAARNAGAQPLETVNVQSLDMGNGSRYAPFFVALSLSAVDMNESESTNDCDSRIFFTNGNDIDSLGDNEPVKLKSWVYSVLASYTYNKKDKAAFESPALRHSLGIQVDMANALMQFRTPRVAAINNNENNKFVVMVIDPVRVFFDLLYNESESDNTNKMYHIEIDNITKKDNVNFVYKVSRVRNGANNKNNVGDLNKFLRMAIKGNKDKQHHDL